MFGRSEFHYIRPVNDNCLWRYRPAWQQDLIGCAIVLSLVVCVVLPFADLRGQVFEFIRGVLQ